MTPVMPPGLLGEVALVGTAGLVGVAIYGALALLLGVEEIRLLGRALLGWSRRLTGSGP
jgi:hypothetical protein